jgi:starch phosphorylase
VRPIQTFTVVPSLPPSIEALREIAYNLRWSWNHECIELFRRLDSDLWESSGHNPVLMLGTIDQEKLLRAACDDSFLAHARRVATELESYVTTDPRWFDKLCPPENADKPRIAYFSAEFGITECLSIFAGGLGILAGDHLKSASDLGLPLVGVGLLYQQGYFRQYLNQAGWQQEIYEDNDFHNLPVSPAVDASGKPVMIRVELVDHPVYARVWRAQVGRIPLYLLDTNIEENPDPADRDITDQLYGGNREMRIQQEILLGIGGYRALAALGVHPTVYHMNEGHSAFLALERVRHLMKEGRLSFNEAVQLASASLVFTTHTPVEAGHDYFSPDLMQRYFGSYARDLGIAMDEFLAIGRVVPDQGEYCMTVLALRLAARANGVSKLHGEVSRKMWQSLWPGVPVEEVPIRHVTNGVHLRSWISLEMNQLFDRYLAPAWHDEPTNSDVWERVYSIPAEELWRTHERRREHMVAWARRRLRDQRIRRGAPQPEIEAASEALNPDALTIGFARRFATYKRATLIFRDMNRLKAILLDPKHPVQLVFSGKAHPKDEAGKELIRQIKEVARIPELARSVIFLEDYDMAVTRYLVEGVDVWLNTPLRPNEASGTSGMKAAANGVLNLSIPDGWWDEVWSDPRNPHSIGWVIGKGESYQDPNFQNQIEAEALYNVLERDVVPTFYERGPDRLPRRWIDRMKDSIASLCPFVNTHRMVRDYMCDYYFKAHQQFRRLEEADAAKARSLAAWTAHVRNEWPLVRVQEVQREAGASVLVGTNVRVRALVYLGALSPADVAVELYAGRLTPAGEISGAVIVRMDTAVQREGNSWMFSALCPCNQSGLHGFTVRVRPSHPDLVAPFIPGLISWASEESLARTATSE